MKKFYIILLSIFISTSILFGQKECIYDVYIDELKKYVKPMHENDTIVVKSIAGSTAYIYFKNCEGKALYTEVRDGIIEVSGMYKDTFGLLRSHLFVFDPVKWSETIRVSENYHPLKTGIWE